MPATVYFADMRSTSPKTSTVGKIERLLAELGVGTAVRKGDLTAIKVHFGELGNDAYVSPVFARKAADAVRAAGGRPFFSDTNTLYSGSRSNGPAHLETAIAHGFDFSVCGAPIVIADGMKSADWREVAIGKKWFERVKIASAFLDADSMVVVSHFKGHEMAGFGGAIKNLAMGCAPAAGKRDQHSCKFFVKEAKCVGCGLCVEVCPVGAPVLSGPKGPGAKASIERATCIGCGECALRCAPKAITMDWKVEIVEFTEKMTEYALGAVKGKEGRVLYLNFVRDVVPECDCAPWSDAPLVADIGILASTDPVAIDQAAFDLVKAAPVAAGSVIEGKAGAGDDKFAAVHPETRGLTQLEYGAAIGLGSREYTLVGI